MEKKIKKLTANYQRFFQKVGKSRKAMIDYLSNHFRYDTMNSWNAATSYAQNMKVNHVLPPTELRDKVFELMDAEGFYDSINELIAEFDMEHDYKYQAGFNGRSGGYLVMYEGQKVVEPYLNDEKLRDIEKGNRVYIADGIYWKSAEEAKAWIGKMKTTISSFPGRGIDGDADFEAWDTSSLQSRVKLVQSFDKLCDAIIAEVVRMAKTYKVKEETYYVAKTRKVIS